MTLRSRLSSKCRFIPLATSADSYEQYKNDKRYFSVVDMNDPDFQLGEVHFQIEGDFIKSFGEILDQISVLVEKNYPGDDNNSFTFTLLFNKQKMDSWTVTDLPAVGRPLRNSGCSRLTPNLMVTGSRSARAATNRERYLFCLSLKLSKKWSPAVMVWLEAYF